MKFSSLVMLIAVFLLNSCNQRTKSVDRDVFPKEIKSNKQQSNNLESANLDFLKKVDGKYPYEIKLLENEILNKRLKSLIGNRYTFLKKTWAVEIPMTFKNNIFVAIACQAHNCDATSFIIVVDFTNNNMSVGIKEENQINLFSENGTISPEINNWVNGKF